MDKMLAEITFIQLLEWAAYADIEKFGEDRADRRTASLLRQTWNMNRDTEKYPEQLDLDTFYHDFITQLEEGTPAKQEQTEELKMALLHEALFKAAWMDAQKPASVIIRGAPLPMVT